MTFEFKFTKAMWESNILDEGVCSGSSTRAECPRRQISKGSATNKAEKHNQLNCL